jgi:hypothetical protein
MQGRLLENDRSPYAVHVLIGLLVLLALISALAIRATQAAVLQSGNLRLTLLSQVQPHLLPRTEKAPIAVFVSGHVDTVKQGVPPQLQGLTIRVNRHGEINTAGLPICDLRQIQPSTTDRAVSACGPALVGSGQFWAHIVLPGQEPYPTHGRLLVFNGKKKGRPAILAHIYTANPFATSFVIPFVIDRLGNGGPYGMQLSASLPRSLGEWGYVDRIKLTLRRKYRVDGRQKSYFNANCPATPGTRSATFQLAQADFTFGGESLTVGVPKSCGVKGK